MTAPDAPLPKRRRRFKMPGAQTIRSRRSTINNAFVNSLMPTIRPSDAEIDEALAILGTDAYEFRCAFCDDAATSWDHLRPLVSGGRPTGYIAEIANLVPACSWCNSHKQNQEWQVWMRSSGSGSPTARGLPSISERIARLEAYEQWRPPVKVEFGKFVTVQELEEYWEMHKHVLAELDVCHEFAAKIRARACEELGLKARQNRTRG